MSDIKKIRPITGIVTKTVQETPDTWTLFLKTPAKDRNYKAGQFLSISPKQFEELSEIIKYFENIKSKKELIRAYSMASAPHEDFVSITIKPERYYPEEDYPPILSPFLASPYMLGRSITFLGYTGPYVLPDDLSKKTDEVLHLVAGSGSVPNLSLLKDQLTQNKDPNVKHTLININKTFEDIIFQKEFEDLALKYSDRFKLINILTREKRKGFEYGRPTLDFIRSHIKAPDKVLVYACGSAVTKWQKRKARETGKSPAPRFIESISSFMHELGIDKKRFKHESYG